MIKVEVNTKCTFCGLPDTISVDSVGYESWKGGTLIQAALPGLSDAEREQLISGTCEDCWEENLDEDDDDADEDEENEDDD